MLVVISTWSDPTDSLILSYQWVERQLTLLNPSSPHCSHPNPAVCVFVCVLFAHHTGILETYSRCTSNPLFVSLFLTHNHRWAALHSQFCIMLHSNQCCWHTHITTYSLYLMETLIYWMCWLCIEQNEKRCHTKNSKSINISLVSSYCLPVVKCFWPLWAVFGVWWPCSGGPQCACVHTAV